MPPNTCSSPGPISEHPARSSGESHLQDELSPVNKVIHRDKLERGICSSLSWVEKQIPRRFAPRNDSAIT